MIFMSRTSNIWVISDRESGMHYVYRGCSYANELAPYLPKEQEQSRDVSNLLPARKRDCSHLLLRESYSSSQNFNIPLNV